MSQLGQTRDFPGGPTCDSFVELHSNARVLHPPHDMICKCSSERYVDFSSSTLHELVMSSDAFVRGLILSQWHSFSTM